MRLRTDKLNLFKRRLDVVGISHRAGKGPYQVLQVDTGPAWGAIYRTNKNPEWLELSEYISNILITSEPKGLFDNLVETGLKGIPLVSSLSVVSEVQDEATDSDKRLDAFDEYCLPIFIPRDVRHTLGEWILEHRVAVLKLLEED